MAQLILARGNDPRRNFFRRIFGGFELGPYFLVVSLVMFVVLITVITLMFSTRQVTKGYVLNRLESEHQNLLKESERKQMQISEVRSLNFIEQSSKVQKMRKPARVVFVNAPDSAIASK